MDDGELTLTFAALADPTRRAILAHLAREDATVNALAGPFPMSLQAVSRHLKVLERAGLITRGRDAQFRPCAFRGTPMEEAASWMADVRQSWRKNMAQLAEEPETHVGVEPERRQEMAPSESAFAPRGDWAR